MDNSAADLDDLATRLWPLVVQRIDELVEMTSEVGSWSVRSNTSLSGDDRRSRPYQTSHAVQSCLATGIDNLHGLRHMMFGAPSEQPSRIVIHQAAHYLLARGALESFATGLWLLTPAARAERVTRTLRWHVQNVKDMHTALEALPDQTLSTTREEKLINLETAITRTVGSIPPGFRRGYSTTEVVRYVDETRGQANQMLSTQFIWQLCSGFAHGRPWASLGFLEREELPTEDPDILHTRMTSDLPRSLMAPQHALDLCEQLLATYRMRNIPHIT